MKIIPFPKSNKAVNAELPNGVMLNTSTGELQKFFKSPMNTLSEGELTGLVQLALAVLYAEKLMKTG